MAAAITDAVGTILAHYADVIEGGNTYNAGTSFNGIPGTQSVDHIVSEMGTFNLAANTSTTVAKPSGDLSTYRANDFDRETTPPLFLCCTVSTTAANLGAARKITSCSIGSTAGTTTLTCGVAFPATLGTGGSHSYVLLEGFRRCPDTFDIEATNVTDMAFDRSFDLNVTAPKLTEWAGSGRGTYEVELRLRLRLLTHGRRWKSRASMLENLGIIRSVLTATSLVETSYTRALIAMPNESADISEDANRIIATDKYRLIYSTSRAYL